MMLGYEYIEIQSIADRLSRPGRSEGLFSIRGLSGISRNEGIRQSKLSQFTSHRLDRALATDH